MRSSFAEGYHETATRRRSGDVEAARTMLNLGDYEVLVVNGTEGGTTALYRPLFECVIFALFGFERERDFVAADLAAGEANMLIATAVERVGGADKGNE